MHGNLFNLLVIKSLTELINSLYVLNCQANTNTYRAIKKPTSEKYSTHCCWSKN